MLLEANENTEEILRGSTGIVYIMFLGRVTYAAEISQYLVPTLYRKSPSVNQAVQRLLSHGSDFLVSKGRHREEGTPGPEAEMYTANHDPLFGILKKYDIRFDRDQLTYTISNLYEASAGFPKLLVDKLTRKTTLIAPFNSILSNYFAYLAHILTQLEADFLPKVPTIGKGEISHEAIVKVLQRHPDTPGKLLTMGMKLALVTFGFDASFEKQLMEFAKSCLNGGLETK